MKSTLGYVAGFGLALSVAASVQAVELENLYVSLAGAVGMTEDHDFDTGADGVGMVDTELGTVLGFKAAVGVEFEAWRVEFEVGQFSSDVEKHVAGGNELPGSKGELMATTFMINAMYDFAGVFGESLTPYLGAGIGYAGISLDGYGVNGVPEVVDDEDASLSYQGIAGLSYSLSEHTGLFVEYNYLSTPGIEVDTTLGANETETDIVMQSFFVGLQYNL